MQNKNIIFVSISLIIILLLGIGVSYSMYNAIKSQDNTNTAYTKCFDVSITSQNNSIDLENMYPISDEKGKKLTPFSFTINNTCDIFASYTVNLESLKGTTLSSEFLKVMLNNEEIKLLSDYEATDTVNTGSIESHTLARGSLGSGDSEDYTLRIWIDYDTTLEDLDNEIKTLKSKIVVKAEPSTWDPVKEGYDTLHDAILANEYQTSPESAIKKIEAKGEPDLSNTAPIIKWTEKIGTSSILSVSKPSENVVEIYNKDTGTGDKNTQASELTLNDTKLKLYTTKTFNSETGKYTMGDPVYVDPTTLDFSGDTKYYYQNEYIQYNQTNGKLRTVSDNGGNTINLISSATKVSSTIKWNNITYEAITYKLSLTQLTGSELETDKSDKGLYQGIDDYGTVYYYRGNIKNNNVYFAGYYWQIVRINGDGSIRLLYNGTEKNATGVKQSINNTTYQFNNLTNSPAYVGYMYGNPAGKSFDDVHANTNDSTIKSVVDDWYKTNIDDKGYNIYVSNDVGFCGDRSLNDGDGIDDAKTSLFSSFSRIRNNLPQLTCPNIERDLYTTADSNIGNNALKYPVGIITADELLYAGIDSKHINKLSYLYSSSQYWTMTPSVYDSSEHNAYEWWLIHIGYVHGWWSVANSNGVRPVINLKADVKISGGIGTSNDPFVVDTNN